MSTPAKSQNLTWAVAKNVLNATDKDRLACCYFYAETSKIDWEGAAAAFGSASSNSFRTMISAANKKVKDAGEKQSPGSAPTTPASKGRNGGGKRKTPGSHEASPSAAKKQRQTKPSKQTVVDSTSDGDDDEAFHKAAIVKAEPVDDAADFFMSADYDGLV